MEFHMINKTYVALHMSAKTEKTTFPCKDDCTLTKHTRRWTYAPLRYFFGGTLPLGNLVSDDPYYKEFCQTIFLDGKSSNLFELFHQICNKLQTRPPAAKLLLFTSIFVLFPAFLCSLWSLYVLLLCDILNCSCSWKSCGKFHMFQRLLGSVLI